MYDPVHPQDEMERARRRGARITALHQKREIPYPETAEADHAPHEQQFADDQMVLAAIRGKARMKQLVRDAHMPQLVRTIDGKRGD